MGNSKHPDEVIWSEDKIVSSVSSFWIWNYDEMMVK